MKWNKNSGRDLPDIVFMSVFVHMHSNCFSCLSIWGRIIEWLRTNILLFKENSVKHKWHLTRNIWQGTFDKESFHRNMYSSRGFLASTRSSRCRVKQLRISWNLRICTIYESAKDCAKSHTGSRGQCSSAHFHQSRSLWCGELGIESPIIRYT